jgi:acetylserotonin N-methyltransferase
MTVATLTKTRRTPLKAGFAPPEHDLGFVLGAIGNKLFVRDRSLAQHVAWSVQHGVLEFLDDRSATMEEVAANTPLTEAGADSLLSVLAAIGFLVRAADGRYSLTTVARDFFLPRSPYFVGDQLDPSGLPIPGPYLRRRADFLTRAKLRLLTLHPSIRYGSKVRIENQHARNLGACAAAVRTGEFAGVHFLIDVAGGSGAFAIPLALEYPSMRIILTDLPRATKNARPLLVEHGLQDRVELLACDAFEYPWKIPACDGMFIGNFLHGFDDAVCDRICRESFERLSSGGTVWVHEMIWNESRDGPLITALWHAAMRGGGPGRQRTAQQLSKLLRDAGFRDIRTIPTSGAFALIRGSKPG